MFENACQKYTRSFMLDTDAICRKGKKVKLSLCLTKHYAMKAYRGVDV
jgi:hypothetical protein